VWLALSELMPTRIRSNGMSIALLVNQFVSTVLAAVFLPVVAACTAAPMFFFWAGCTVVYFWPRPSCCLKHAAKRWKKSTATSRTNSV
jgi:hypothetical protein